MYSAVAEWSAWLVRFGSEKEKEELMLVERFFGVTSGNFGGIRFTGKNNFKGVFEKIAWANSCGMLF